MRILVVNAGSSSLKLRVVDDEDVLVGSEDSGAGGGAGGWTRDDVAAAAARLGPVDAVGHRVVHGGTRFREATVVDEIIVGELDALTDLAPLHQPGSIAGLRAARAALPGVPHVACFDTAFHGTLPAAASTYALPGAWRERWPLRRYGFHGLSHAYVARRAAEVLGRPLGELRLVTAHLGAGASLAAVQGGRSVETTMGFTPLEGLVMATRSGSIDPGLVLWLQQHGGLPVEEIAAGLERKSGILGLSGTADFRELLPRVDAGSKDAQLALDVYVHHVRAGVAAMAAAMDGIDALVFTAGIGENAPTVRARVLEGLSFLGLAVDAALNDKGDGDRRIGRAGSAAEALVVFTREEIEIARQVRRCLEG